MKKLINMQTKDVVAESIRNEILSGGIAAGEELKQELLAEMLGVSRMPVREALQLLEQEGYIERLPNRHMVAVDLSPEKLCGIMRMIAAMEMEIIVQVCGMKDTKSGSDEPQRFLMSMKQALDEDVLELAAEYELEYHYALLRLLGNTYIEQLFGKALEGYLAFAVKRQNRDIGRRLRLLCEMDDKRRSKDTDGIVPLIRSYYRELFDSWNRKESDK